MSTQTTKRLHRNTDIKISAAMQRAGTGMLLHWIAGNPSIETLRDYADVIAADIFTSMARKNDN